MAYQDYYYPDALKDTAAFPASIYFAFFDRRSTAESAPADNVHLYMPESFNSCSPVEWDPYKGLTLATQAASGVAGFLGKTFTPQIHSQVQKLMAAGGGQALDSLNTAFQLGFGVAPNPYLAQIFRNVGFRAFAFTFRLVPFSEKDCVTINNIIRCFRRWALPAGGIESWGASSPYLTYPRRSGN